MAKVQISLSAVEVSISRGLISIQTGEDPDIKISIEMDADAVGINSDDVVKVEPVKRKPSSFA